MQKIMKCYFLREKMKKNKRRRRGRGREEGRRKL